MTGGATGRPRGPATGRRPRPARRPSAGTPRTARSAFADSATSPGRARTETAPATGSHQPASPARATPASSTTSATRPSRIGQHDVQRDRPVALDRGEGVGSRRRCAARATVTRFSTALDTNPSTPSTGPQTPMRHQHAAAAAHLVPQHGERRQQQHPAERLDERGGGHGAGVGRRGGQLRRPRIPRSPRARGSRRPGAGRARRSRQAAATVRRFTAAPPDRGPRVARPTVEGSPSRGAAPHRPRRAGLSYRAGDAVYIARMDVRRARRRRYGAAVEQPGRPAADGRCLSTRRSPPASPRSPSIELQPALGRRLLRPAAAALNIPLLLAGHAAAWRCAAGPRASALAIAFGPSSSRRCSWRTPCSSSAGCSRWRLLVYSGRPLAATGAGCVVARRPGRCCSPSTRCTCRRSTPATTRSGRAVRRRARPPAGWCAGWSASGCCWPTPWPRSSREQAARERALLLDERARIARELHDVVAHAVSVMVVQAGAARFALGEDEDEVRERLLSVEDDRPQRRRRPAPAARMLLRADDGRGAERRGPQPGLARLDELVAGLQRAGLPVRLDDRRGCRSTCRRWSTSPPTGWCRRRSPTCSSTRPPSGCASRCTAAAQSVVARGRPTAARRAADRARPALDGPGAGRDAGARGGSSAAGSRRGRPGRAGGCAPSCRCVRRPDGRAGDPGRPRRRPGAGPRRVPLDPRPAGRHRGRRRGGRRRRGAGRLPRASSPTSSAWTCGCPGWTASRRPGGCCRQSDAAPRVLVLTTFDLDRYVYDALRAGASGFLVKDAPPERLVAAVRAVAAGEELFAPTVLRRLVEAYVREPPDERAATSWRR